MSQFSPMLFKPMCHPDSTTILLPDFGKSELHAVFNLLYTGRYDAIINNRYITTNYRSSFKTAKLLAKMMSLLTALQIYPTGLQVDSEEPVPTPEK